MTSNQDKTDRPEGDAGSPSHDTTAHTGSADPNRAADMMKDRDQSESANSNTGGIGMSEGADTDGAGTGGMVEREDAGGGPAGVGGSSGAADQ